MSPVEPKTTSVASSIHPVWAIRASGWTGYAVPAALRMPGRQQKKAEGRNKSLPSARLPCVRQSSVGDEHQGAGSGQRAAGAVDDTGLRAGLLAGDAIDAVFRRARELAIRFHQQLHAVHAAVVEGETAAVGVDRQA